MFHTSKQLFMKVRNYIESNGTRRKTTICVKKVNTALIWEDIL